MSWEDASPVIAKVVHSAKAAVSILADGRTKIMLTFSEPFFRELGSPEKLIIQTGSGDRLGMVRLVPDPEGKFVVNEMKLGGARVYLSLPPTLERIEREIEPCEIIERPEGLVPGNKVPMGSAWVLKLPIDAWKAQGAKPAAPPASKPAAPPPAPQGPQGHTSSRPLVAHEYLRKNGVACHKLAGDWWMLDGSRVGKMEVLARVNEYRKRADLPVLGLDNIE